VKKILLKIVSSNRLNIEEVELFKFVQQWISVNHQQTSEQVIKEILSHIRFSLIPMKDLINVVKPSKLVEAEVLLDAFEFQMEPGHFDKSNILLQSRKPFKLANLWWKEYCGTNLTISGSVVTKTRGTLGWNAGVLGTLADPSSFKVRLINKGRGQIAIGLAPKSSFKLNAQNIAQTCGWYLLLESGLLYSHQDNKRKATTFSVQNGSIVEVLYDKKGKRISFVVDGNLMCNDFSDIITNEELYPALDICSVDSSLELLSE